MVEETPEVNTEQDSLFSDFSVEEPVDVEKFAEAEKLFSNLSSKDISDTDGMETFDSATDDAGGDLFTFPELEPVPEIIEAPIENTHKEENVVDASVEVANNCIDKGGYLLVETESGYQITVAETAVGEIIKGKGKKVSFDLKLFKSGDVSKHTSMEDVEFEIEIYKDADML